MPPKVTINHDGTATLTFPFNRQLVDEIKRLVLPHQRTYDPDAKAWTVTPGAADVAIHLMRRYFGPDLVINDTRTHHTPPDRAARDFAALHLLPSAPPQLVRAAYKTLATICHPDMTSGDGDQMRALNASYASLRDAGAA